MLNGKTKAEDRAAILRVWSTLSDVPDGERPGKTDDYIALCEEYKLKWGEYHNEGSVSDL